MVNLISKGLQFFAAAGTNDTAGNISAPTDITIVGLFKTIAGILPVIVILVFLGIIIYGGFLRMTAAGNPDQEEKSSQVLLAGVIGFVIIALAPLLINLLGKLLGIPGNLITY